MSQSQVVYKSIPISVDKSPGDFEAIALYDNQSDSSDELNFKKGDVLKILERDFHGLTGWWLCALRDKIGLAPGNRLEVVGNIPEKPHNFRMSDSKHIDVTELSKGKLDGDIYKSAYGLYDVPKIVYNLQPAQQQETEKQHEIPDILKDQTVNASNRSNSNHILYSGLAKSPPLEEIAIQKDHVYNSPDAYIWPDDLSLIPNGKKNSYNSSVHNGGLSSGKGSVESLQSAPWTGSLKVSPTMNVATYSNLQQPSTLSQIGSAELKPPQLVYQAPVNKRIVYTDSDNYDNLCAPTAALINGQQSRSAKENSSIVATTSNNMNKNANGSGKQNDNVNFQYRDSRDPYRFFNGSQTLQHRPRRSEECRTVARDDSDLQMKYKNDTKGKRDRSLRRVRFADQVTSSDTEEWTKNSDPIPNQNAVPLKPILSSSLSKSNPYCNTINGQSAMNRNNNGDPNHNNEISSLSSKRDLANKQNNQKVFYQADVPDYENPYSEIADQPIYEKPPLAYISTTSKLNVDNQNGKPGKCYTSEFTTVLNTRDAGSNSQGENGDKSSAHYKNQIGAKQIQPPSLHQKFEGVYISPPDYGNSSVNEPEFQLQFVDLPKKDQDKNSKSEDGLPKLSTELLNKSKEKIQILASSMDGILNRKNAEDAEIATVILKSIDVELHFLVSVCEKGLKKSIETWSEDLIETLLQHLEDLRTIQGTLALLNKQILELSRDKSNLLNCQTFETICSSCALSARNICYPVHLFVAYLLPKFKFLFPISFNDIGRLAPSPTFNNNPSSYSTMTRNQLKGKIPDNPGYSSLTFQGLTIPKNVPIGRVPSPIPKIASVPSYNGNNISKEALYYEDIPYNVTMRQLSPNDSGTSNKFEGRHLGSNQILESRINSANNCIKPGPSYSTLPSQMLQGRPLPPPPPSYSSVVGQTSYVPQQAPLSQMSLSNTQLQPANFARMQISPRNSPVFNNNIYSGLNSFNNDSA